MRPRPCEILMLSTRKDPGCERDIFRHSPAAGTEPSSRLVSLHASTSRTWSRVRARIASHGAGGLSKLVRLGRNGWPAAAYSPRYEKLKAQAKRRGLSIEGDCKPPTFAHHLPRHLWLRRARQYHRRPSSTWRSEENDAACRGAVADACVSGV